MIFMSAERQILRPPTVVVTRIIALPQSLVFLMLPDGVQGTTEGDRMQWSKPSFQDIRFGFEITMYIATR